MISQTMGFNHIYNTRYDSSYGTRLKSGHSNNKNEDYRPISLMNTGAKILNKILVNKIQSCIKKIIY